MVVRTCVSYLALCSALAAQTYTAYRIDTVAGGVIPDGVPGASVGLHGVFSVAAGPRGEVYFQAGPVILRISADGLLTRVAGNGTQGSAGDGGLATQANIGYQSAMAVDAAGNLFLAESDRVRKVANGIITTVAGGGDLLQDGIPATRAQLASPRGIAIDRYGDIFVSDTGHSVIRKVSKGVITTIAGTGASGYSGDNGPAIYAQLSAPQALAFDNAGGLYVADGGSYRVRKIGVDGAISTVAGTGVSYDSPQEYQGPPTGANLAISAFSGLAFDAQGNLYISTLGFVRKLTHGNLTTVAGSAYPAGFASRDGQPATEVGLIATGMTVDAAGNIYIASEQVGFGDRIRKVSNGIITTIAGGGAAVGDDGPATSAVLGEPDGVALDAAGNLYIADRFNGRVRRVANGSITTIAGTGAGSMLAADTGDGGPATQATLNQPSTVAVDTSGNVWIGDAAYSIREVSHGIIQTVVSKQNGAQQNENAFVIAPDGAIYWSEPLSHVVRQIAHGMVTTLAGTGAPGYSGDNGPATSAQLNFPTGLALDSTGALYLADASNYAIRKVSKGIITTVATGFIQPSWIACDAAGNLFVSDAFDIKQVSTDRTVTRIAGGGRLRGDGGPATDAWLAGPAGLAVDASGRVYFADSYNNRVRVLTPYQAACSYDVVNTASVAQAAANTQDVALQTQPGCPWAAANLPAWITAPASGTGASTISVNVAANPGAARAATFSLGGVLISIAQHGLKGDDLRLVSAANYYNGPFAAGSIVSIFGNGLATGSTAAPALPLPTVLGGVSVTLHDAAGVDRAVPLYYVSPSQINLQIPDATSLGSGVLSVTTAGQSLRAPIQISSTAPAFFTLNSADLAAATIVRVAADGTQSFESVYQVSNGAVLPRAIDLGPPTDRVFLSLYGTGIRNAENVSVTVGAQQVWVSATGRQGYFPGLDQINILLPRTLAAAGLVPISISTNTQSLFNTVSVVIQ